MRSKSLVCAEQVSIHAPTWGATHEDIKSTERYLFQSTLPHGERPMAIEVSSIVSCFNPRSHMGSDATTDTVKLTQKVSIHAPTWGATFLINHEQCNEYVSIHAPTWGATYNFDYLNGNSMFQSTLPHGERHSIKPRNVQSYSVSIHAPTWGATLLLVVFRAHGVVSIHAPTWGAT